MAFTLRPASGTDFVDRDTLLAEMVETLTNPEISMGFALYGRRRVGKTSIFKELERRLQDEPTVVCVYVSLWDLVEGTLFELTQAWTTAVLDAYRRKGSLPLRHRAKHLMKLPLDAVKDLLSDLGLTVKLRDELEFLISYDPKSRKLPVSELLEHAFALPEALAAETGTRCVLLVDEFPSIIDLKDGTRLGEGVIRKVRTLHEGQHHTVLNISGSIRKTMEITALASSSVFYGQFIVREIGPLDRDDVRELVERNLNVSLNDSTLDALWSFTQGIPFYVQFLGRELTRLRPAEITRQTVEAAVEVFLSQEGDTLFREELERLSSKERTVARVMASEGFTAPSQIAQVMGEGLNIIGRYLRYLEEKGVIRREARGVYRFEDPVFSRWLASRS